MKNIGDDTLCALLNHEDDRVKVNAASFCLNSEVLVEQSILALEKIIADSDDPTICFSAKCYYKNSDELYQQARRVKHLRNGFYTADIGMSCQNRCWCFTFSFWRFMLPHF